MWQTVSERTIKTRRGEFEIYVQRHRQTWEVALYRGGRLWRRVGAFQKREVAKREAMAELRLYA